MDTMDRENLLLGEGTHQYSCILAPGQRGGDTSVLMHSSPRAEGRGHISTYSSPRAEGRGHISTHSSPRVEGRGHISTHSSPRVKGRGHMKKASLCLFVCDYG